MKKISMLLLLVLSPVFALFSEEKAPVLDVTLNVANTYIWRGMDMQTAVFRARGQADGIFNTSLALQPEIKYRAPIEGLAFDIWASFGALGRDDAGGALRQVDEVDYTISYDFSNRLGDWKAGYILYTYGFAGIRNYGELYFGYTLPVILKPGIVHYITPDDGGNTAYTMFSLSHSFGNFSPSLTFSIWSMQARASNYATLPNHINLNLPFSFSLAEGLNLNVGATLVYRLLPATSTDSALKALINVGLSYSL